MKRRDNSMNSNNNKRTISDTILLIFVAVHSLRVLSFYPLDYAMTEIHWLPTSFFTAFILALCSAFLLFFHQPCANYGSLKILFKRENFLSLFTNGVVLAMSLQCWLYGLRNTSAGCTAIFEAGGLCVATILSSCLKPVKTERGRLRLFYATVIIIGYVIVTVSPVGHGAAASLNKNNNIGNPSINGGVLMNNVHQIVKQNAHIAGRNDNNNNNNIIDNNEQPVQPPNKLRGNKYLDDTNDNHDNNDINHNDAFNADDVRRRRRRRLHQLDKVNAEKIDISKIDKKADSNRQRNPSSSSKITTFSRQPISGLLCILLSLLLEHGQSKASKALEKRTGGKHRLTTIITIIALCISLIFALLSIPGIESTHPKPNGGGMASGNVDVDINNNISSNPASTEKQAATTSSLSSLFVYNVGFFSFIGYLIPYYIDTFVTRRLSGGSSSGIHTVGSLIVLTAAVTAFVVDFVTNGTFYKNILYLIGVVIVCAASDSLTKVILPGSKVSQYNSKKFGQGFINDGINSNNGNLINSYVPGMGCIEIFFGNTRSIVGNSVNYFGSTFPQDDGSVEKSKSRNHGFFNHMTSNKESVRIFAFVCLNAMFMFVELLVGWYSNSLGLISDAGHMLFDNGALFIGLYAAYMSRWPADSSNSFGYGRYEVLCAFVNGIFLVFIAFTILFEGFDRVGQPPKVYGKHLLWTSIVGFIVNAIGIFLFHDMSFHLCGNRKKSDHSKCSHPGHHHGHSHGHSHGHGKGNHNIHAMFLHIVADALGSMGVIVSSVLVKYFDLYIADPICSLLISILIILSVVPLLKDSAYILLLGTPPEFLCQKREFIKNLNAIEGVKKVSDVHVWTLKKDFNVGSCTLTVEKDCDHQDILSAARKLWGPMDVQYGSVQVIEEDE